MKARNLIIIAATLLLGAQTVGCSDDGGTDPTNNQTNNEINDAGTDTGGDTSTGDTGTDISSDASDGGETDVSDAGDISDTDPSDASDVEGDAADGGADGGEDAGDTAPPPDDLDPLTGEWSDDYSVPGLVGPEGGVVNVLYNDTANDAIYAAGGFSTAGIASATNIAKWNGTNWEALGDGLDIGVAAMTTDSSGTLYAAGSGGGGGGGIGIPSPNIMFSWDGSQWAPFAPITPSSSRVSDMITLTNGDIIVAGDFDGVMNQTINHVARFDGTDWTPIDPANEPDAPVHDLVETANGFCIAGEFENIGSVQANYTACWDGTKWQSLGAGPSSDAHVLLPQANGEFLAGGHFGLAKFDGRNWTSHAGSVAGGSITDVRVLHEGDSGQVYVGGTFDYVGPSLIFSQNFARLDGTTWSAVGTGLHERSRIAVGSTKGTNAVASLGSDEYLVGGFFTNASDVFAPNLAKWTGAKWETFVNGDSSYLGADGNVRDFATGPNGDLYVGGQFDHVGTSGSPGVARFDGSSWESLGEGLDDGSNGAVHTVTVDQNGTVYAGGNFQYAGSNVVSWIAKWDGSQWQSVGYGLNGPVADLAAGPNGNLYAAGEFTLADGQDVGGIAKWDGTNWQPMAEGFADVGSNSGDKEVNAVAVDENGTVYAGGSFVETTNFTVVKHLAKWDGSQWVEVGGSVEDHQSDTGALDDTGVVYDLDFWGSKLVVAGNFGKAGTVDANSIALWDGTNWEALATGVPPRWQGGRPGTVFSVAPKANGLFIATNAEEIDGTHIGFVGWWDGSAWHGLEEGTGDVAETLIVYDHSLFVGGPFVGTGGENGVPSFHIARWEYEQAVSP